MADITSHLPTIDEADGSVTAGTAASVAILTAGQFNTVLPTLTNTQQAAIQLDASGRAIVSPLTTASTVKVDLQDGSGNAITSASNGNAAQQLLGVQLPDTTIANATLGALNAIATIVMAGLGSVGFQINAGTLIGTLTAEVSIDGGSTYVPTLFFNPATNDTVSSLVFASSNPLTVYSIVTIGGTSHVQVKVTAYTSGTATALLRASNATTGGVSSTFGGSVAIFNTATLTYPATIANTAVLLLAANANRKYAMISSPTTTLQCQLGTSTGLTNNTGFTISTGTFFELKGDNLFTGAIYGFAPSAKTISVTEGTL